MSNGHMWVRFKDPSDVERVRAAFLVRAVEEGLTWVKPRLSKTTGEVVGRSLTTIIDVSVLTLGRLVFCGKPVVGDGLRVLDPEIVVTQSLIDDLVDTAALVLPTPERVREITRDAGVEMHLTQGQDGLKTVVYDLSMETELETQQHGVITVADAIGVGGTLRCQSPFRASDSWAALFSVDKNGSPRVYDFGTTTTHRIPIEHEFDSVEVEAGEPQGGLTGLHGCLVPLDTLLDTSDFLPHCLEPWIPLDEVTLLAGHGGGGKSYVALMIAVHVALGLPFGNMQPTQANVLFFSAEDGAQVLRHRMAKICRALKIESAQLEGKLYLLDASDIDPALHREQRIYVNGVSRVFTETPLLGSLAKLVQEVDAGLVIVDNASDTFDDDEIKRARVRAFIRALRSRIARPGRAVLLLAHINKASASGGRGTEDYSGSTAWHNSVRSRLSLSPDGDHALKIEHMKANLGTKALPVRLVWSEGVPMVAGTHTSAGAEAAAVAEKVRDDADKSALVKLIQDFDKRGERVTTSFQGSATVFRLLKGQPGFPKSTVSERLMRLLRDLENEERIFRRTVKTPDRKFREVFTCALIPAAEAGKTAVGQTNFCASGA